MIPSVLRTDYQDLFFFIDRGECGLNYSPRTREFSLFVRPGSPVVQQLLFCPFSGRALPRSLRTSYFDELEKIGLADGLNDIDKAPEEFQSERWWIEREL